MQEWIKETGHKLVILFEGRDAAGKGGTIKRITEALNPRMCRVVALPAPTEREHTQWYFQRYVAHLPSAGEIVIYDRSWYNRAGVERVMGFCTEEEYQEFMRSCPEFERMLVRSGIQLIKYWFSVSDEEQERRFQKRLSDRTKRWKLSPMDLESRKRWVDYSKAKDEMFGHTDIKQAPWSVVESDVKNTPASTASPIFCPRSPTRKSRTSPSFSNRARSRRAMCARPSRTRTSFPTRIRSFCEPKGGFAGQPREPNPLPLPYSGKGAASARTVHKAGRIAP